MRRLLTAASNMTLSLALAFVLFTGVAVAQSPPEDPTETSDPREMGIRCQGPPPNCVEVIPCALLSCCDTIIVFRQCACNCW